MWRSNRLNALRTLSWDGSGSTAASYYGDRVRRGGGVSSCAVQRCAGVAHSRRIEAYGACPAGEHMKAPKDKRALRSRLWFDDASNPGMTALYLERYLNFGLTRHELQSGKPIIGIAQSGSDLSPCNRHHLELAVRIREGIREAGGVAIEFPTHPIQETGKRPTAALDRNLAYLSLVEVLFGYPLDGV